MARRYVAHDAAHGDDGLGHGVTVEIDLDRLVTRSLSRHGITGPLAGPEAPWTWAVASGMPGAASGKDDGQDRMLALYLRSWSSSKD